MVSDVNSINRKLEKLQLRLLTLLEQRITLKAELRIAKLRNNHYRRNWEEKKRKEKSAKEKKR